MSDIKKPEIVDNKEQEKKARHILALSGGKDSSALAIYMMDKVPDMEYVFCDTGEELEETYEYISKLQEFLCKKIIWLKSERDFKYYLDMYSGVLPDARARWCTRMLKLKPYEEFIGDELVVSYVGIRADEPYRKGYISKKPNITTLFPFIENNIRHDDVMRILTESGLGLPDYYKWRSRSGCYFCFFQQKREWIGLLENHPDLYEKAKAFEKYNPETGEGYTWIEGKNLGDLSHPDSIRHIKNEYEKRRAREENKFIGHQKLMSLWSEDDVEDEHEVACNICHL
jgi:3'-phosphoadenosine 5'-phosphosulfate sulfotransferase (PAPS reductase)/FAD synthetase